MSIDDLVRERAAAVEVRDDVSFDPAALWQAGRARRRRARLAAGATGTVLSLALAGGVVLSVAGGSGSGPRPAAAASPSPGCGLGDELDGAVLAVQQGDSGDLPCDAAAAPLLHDVSGVFSAAGDAPITVVGLSAAYLTDGRTPASLGTEILDRAGQQDHVVVLLVGHSIGVSAGTATGLTSAFVDPLVAQAQSAVAGHFDTPTLDHALTALVTALKGQLAGHCPTDETPLAAAAVGHRETLYLGCGAEGSGVVDPVAVNQAVDTLPITVVVLPSTVLAGGVNPKGLAAQLGERGGDDTRIVLLIAGRMIAAAAGVGTGFTDGEAETLVENATRRHPGAFDRANVEGTIADFAASVRSRLASAHPGVLAGSATPSS